MAYLGAKSADHLEWLDSDLVNKLNDFDFMLIKEFVLKTPAVGVSRFSDGFIDRFSIDSMDGAVALRELLMEGLETYPSIDSAEKLRQTLVKSDLLVGDFWTHGEFVIMTTNTPNDASSQLACSIVASNSGLAKDRTRLIRAPVEWIDALFRHLRNAIAHGQFARFSECEMYVFQDSNKDGNISSRMVLSKARLERWVTQLNRLEITGV